MFELLEKNNAAFQEILEEEEPELKSKGGSYKSKELFKLLKVIKKNSKQFTDFQDEYLSKVLEKIDEGGLTKKTISNTLNAVKLLGDEINDPLIVINTVRDSIPENLLEDHFVDNKPKLNEKSEVVLSMYLKKQ